MCAGGLDFLAGAPGGLFRGTKRTADGRDGKYHGTWGAPPKQAFGPTDDGTVPIYGHLGFLPIWPDDFHDPERVTYRNPSIDALVTLFKNGRIFDDALGFGDAINRVPEPDTGLPFYNMVTFGIDNGPIVMGIENERTGLFWRMNLLCQELTAAGIPVTRMDAGCLTTMSANQKTPAKLQVR